MQPENPWQIPRVRETRLLRYESPKPLTRCPMPDLRATVQQVSRMANRAKREALFRVPPLRTLAEERHERRLRRHVSRLPALAAGDREVVARIRDHGVHVATLDGLALPGTTEVKAQLDRLVEELAAQPATSSTLRPPREDLLADIAVWRFGLSDRMLDIAENYLGLPARYYGADVRREVADGRPPHHVRQWHRDVEDHQILKVLVWLNDVDADGGPFAYIPRTRSAEVVDRLRYVGGFVSDEKIRRIAPEDEWHLATGPKWTAVMPDTARVLHRATPPEARDRYSVTFTWTSRRPIKTFPKEPFTPDQVRRIREGLSARQLACLPRALAYCRE
jgi:hypothetical protein